MCKVVESAHVITFCWIWDRGSLNCKKVCNDKIILLGIRLNFILADKMSEIMTIDKTL